MTSITVFIVSSTATILDKPTPGDANSTLKSEELPSSPTKSYVRTHLHGFNTTLTEEQLETLCSIYDANPIPNDFLKKEIQDTTGLALPLVEYWFQCRRNSDINFQTVLSQRMKQLVSYSSFIARIKKVCFLADENLHGKVILACSRSHLVTLPSQICSIQSELS